jgi:Cell Wall Hydrolase
MSLVADLPQDLDPGHWPELALVAATIYLEAESEPEIGQLAVSYVIRNRMDKASASARVVILGKDQLAQGDGKPYEAWSCWNDDYVPARKSRLAQLEPTRWERAWRCACAAYWKLVPDPTSSADFYLNVELTKKLRGGSLPSWFDPKRVTVQINQHTFLRS